jgi:hypothetical protein
MILRQDSTEMKSGTPSEPHLSEMDQNAIRWHQSLVEVVIQVHFELIALCYMLRDWIG